MARDLILGTAGHIDHGKTALVKALTGIDCDRLPEEKARGITIDIGFARLDLPPFHLGVVDVPGHERFIKNMLAGASGVDLALLVVAADDSVMPQTREHLEILRLLGLRHGVIALTKTDLVDDVTREVVEMEIRELVQGTFLADAPIVPTSAHTGAGLPELKAAIADACRRVEERGGREWFRLAIDRSFIVQGYGAVDTGSVTSGSLRVGDEVEWQPRGERVRVRSLQNHDQPVEEVRRGQRAAINLAGVRHEDVVRGQEVAAPGYLVPSRVLTVRLHCLGDMKRPIKHRLPVRFHVGTSEIMGVVALLDCDAIPPGQWGLAQVFLDEPATATWGQPFVVRESSARQAALGNDPMACLQADRPQGAAPPPGDAGARSSGALDRQRPRPRPDDGAGSAASPATPEAGAIARGRHRAGRGRPTSSPKWRDAGDLVELPQVGGAPTSAAARGHGSGVGRARTGGARRDCATSSL